MNKYYNSYANSLSTTIQTQHMFFEQIKEQLEFQRFQLMKKVSDLNYAIASITHQLEEVETNINKVKEGILVRPLFLKPSLTNSEQFIVKLFRNSRPPIPCNLCTLKFKDKKTLKEHKYEIHSM